MKKILLGFIAIGLLTFVGCEKDDDTDTETTDNQTVNNTQTNSNNSSDGGSTDDDSSGSDCGDNTSKLTSGFWIPSYDPDDIWATLRFSPDGKYYENGEYDGDWTNINNCDSIYVKRPFWSFYLVIVSITENELKIINPVFGEFLYINSETSSDDGSDERDEVIDADGNVYKTIIIDEYVYEGYGQEWMAENLRTTKYNDGTVIPNVTDDEEWSNLSTGAWCNYDNDNQYDSIYGKLYNWHAVSTNKLCPAGWHVPTITDLNILESHLDGLGISYSKAGTALKATSGWESYYGSGNGTDRFGWNGLPGGGRHHGGLFDSFGYGGSWWTSLEDDYYSAEGSYFSLSYSFDYVYRDGFNKHFGFSVRCLRD